MPAISCHKCRRLISDKESNCPFCKAPQRLERTATSLTKGFFTKPQEVVTWIVGVNILLYVASIFLDPSEAFSMDQGLLGIGSPTMRSLGILGSTGNLVLKHQPNDIYGIVADPFWGCGHWWTLLTASFLHGSILHIYFNMSWLKQLGTITVNLLGPARFIITYIITGVGGFLLSNLLGNDPTVGASCSIFGLMGVLVVFAKFRGGVLGERLSKQIWIWIGIGLLFGWMVEVVNNTGHIGGLITGIGLGFLFPSHENRREQGWLQFLAIALLGISILAIGWNGYVVSDIFKTYDELGRFFCDAGEA